MAGCVTQPELTLSTPHYTMLILAAKSRKNFKKKKKKAFIHLDTVAGEEC